MDWWYDGGSPENADTSCRPCWRLHCKKWSWSRWAEGSSWCERVLLHWTLRTTLDFGGFEAPLAGVSERGAFWETLEVWTAAPARMKANQRKFRSRLEDFSTPFWSALLDLWSQSWFTGSNVTPDWIQRSRSTNVRGGPGSQSDGGTGASTINVTVYNKNHCYYKWLWADLCRETTDNKYKNLKIKLEIFWDEQQPVDPFFICVHDLTWIHLNH